MGGPPHAEDLIHLSRWYRHISSFEDEFDVLPADSNVDLSEYIPTAEAGTTEQSDTTAPAPVADDEEEDEEAARAREERLREYQARKAAKPKPAGKTIFTLDIKPWDDETPMPALEANARAIEKDGLVWGQSQLVDVGYGIKKLRINVVVEDDKVQVEDDLLPEIGEDEDHVQSADVVSNNSRRQRRGAQFADDQTVCYAEVMTDKLRDGAVEMHKEENLCLSSIWRRYQTNRLLLLYDVTVGGACDSFSPRGF